MGRVSVGGGLRWRNSPLKKGDIGGFLRGSVGDIHNGIIESWGRILEKNFIG